MSSLRTYEPPNGPSVHIEADSRLDNGQRGVWDNEAIKSSLRWALEFIEEQEASMPTPTEASATSD